jgi:FlaA1/EpsC-like NDP-sugar epimerase
LLERFPAEGVRTNVLATRDLLALARDHDVERFVNISTDKAASPVSVLGYTKRIAERLTASIAAETGRPYLSVRFGNVLGSRGSVLDVFQAQIRDGGPVTVTHPDVTRFFMTTAEAVELVLQAGAIGEPGEALVLDMGEPVRIADVARRLAQMAGPDIELVFTGLRPGEKLEEVLLAPGELDARPHHPLIAQVPVPPLAEDALDTLALDSPHLVAAIAELCIPSAPAVHAPAARVEGEEGHAHAVRGPGEEGQVEHASVAGR